MTATQYGLGAVRRHFAQVAGVYGAVRTTDVEPARDLVTLLPAGALRGLEVGCGTGRYTELLLEHLAAGSSIVGVDACFEMIQVLRRTVRPNAAIRLVCGDAAEPELSWERQGDVNEVVFVQGAHLDGDDLYLTYGAADRCVGAAVASASRLLDALSATHARSRAA